MGQALSDVMREAEEHFNAQIDSGLDHYAGKIAKRVIRRPSHCPNCGLLTEIVRHVMSNMFEVYCQPCEYGAVIMSDDRVALPKEQA